MEENGIVKVDGLWSDVLLVEKPEPTISYRTGWVVYEESLTHGQFVGRGWNGSGFISFYDGRINPAETATPQAFWLELDGQLLGSHWEWGSFEKLAGSPDKPAALHTIITLRHELRPVTVKVHTLLDGTPVITRWLEVTNTGTQPAALAAAYSWSGILQKTNRWKAHLGNSGLPLYSLGYFENPHWIYEGDFRWHDLPSTSYRVDGRYRRHRHRQPFFVLRNNATGEHFIGQLAWSGGYSFEFDLDAVPPVNDESARLFFRAGPESPAPQRVIAPQETISTPEMHLGLVIGDLDEAINAMHDHLRRSVMSPQARGRGGWIESSIGIETDFTVEQVYNAIEEAAQWDTEVFFIDAQWYTPPKGNWWSTVGDWEVDRKRFPEGLAPIRQRVHEKGMLFGLWLDTERVGTESRVWKEHPEWIVVADDGNKRPDGLLDLANPVVGKWLEEQITRVITDYGLEFFRLDYNPVFPPFGYHTMHDGYDENGYWRYYENLYAMYDRLRQRFPEVIFENCAGGGGRTDIGWMRRFNHTSVTDWPIAPRSFIVTNGMTMALPPEYVDRIACYNQADFDFQTRLLFFARPTFWYLNPLGAKPNPLLFNAIKRVSELYKNFVYPMLPTARIYHHTPVVPGPEPQGWGVLELASSDRRRGLVGLFQLAAPTEPEYLLRVRGLDASRRYRVTWDNTGQVSEVDGFVLMKQGITVRLESAISSELLLFEAIL